MSDLFRVNYDRQSELLRGKILHAGPRIFTVSVAEGYCRSENDRGIYKPIVDMQPGEIYCPRSRNTILFLIACFDGGAPGGCVLIRQLLSNDKGAIDKPGNVSAALGITEPKTTGQILELPNGELRLGLFGSKSVSPPLPSTLPPKVQAGIGEKVIKRLMPKIAAAYARRGKSESFQAFLVDLLERCHSEAELLAALKR